jgi:uncharacterized membrane protein YraQ (UPF0718 family)
MTAIIVNIFTLIFLIYSLCKNVDYTKKAFLKAGKKGLYLLPTLFLMIIIIGLIMSFIPRDMIQKYMGRDMNIIQVLLASLTGAIAMIPSLIALPLAGSLVDNGASYVPIAAFITSLTMVGFITIPIELHELGKRITILRNLFAFVFAAIIALLMGVFM